MEQPPLPCHSLTLWIHVAAWSTCFSLSPLSPWISLSAVQLSLLGIHVPADITFLPGLCTRFRYPLPLTERFPD